MSEIFIKAIFILSIILLTYILMVRMGLADSMFKAKSNDIKKEE